MENNDSGAEYSDHEDLEETDDNHSTTMTEESEELSIIVAIPISLDEESTFCQDEIMPDTDQDDTSNTQQTKAQTLQSNEYNVKLHHPQPTIAVTKMSDKHQDQMKKPRIVLVEDPNHNQVYHLLGIISRFNLHANHARDQ